MKRLMILGITAMCLASLTACGGSDEGPVTPTASTSTSAPVGPGSSDPVPPVAPSPTSVELPRDPNADPATQTSAPAVPPAALPSLSASGTGAPNTPTGAATSAPAAMMTVPVYWVGTSNANPWLYREFRRVPANNDIVVDAAVSAMMASTPTDPDYRTAWRKPSHLVVTRRGSAIGVDLSPDAFASTTVGTALANASIQQLVWTATAAAGSPGPVTITVNGQGYDAWGAVRLGVPMMRTTGARAPIWIDYPTQGQSLPAGKLTISGSANVFEGHVSLEVVSSTTGTVMASTYTTAAMGTYADFSTPVTLPAGRYVLHAWSPDASGRPGVPARQFEVTTSFVVR